MAIKEYKPTTPSRRRLAIVKRDGLSKTRPHKKLLRPKTRSSGRNNLGRITSRHRGGGHKRRYRLIDFTRFKDGVPGFVRSVEYDPNRTANIALVSYMDGDKRYIIAPQGVVEGVEVMAGEEAEIAVGNTLPLWRVPDGTVVHNVELKPGKGGQIARAAGTSVRLMAKEGDFALLRLPSGELRRVRKECRATIGVVGNADHSLEKHGKAGRRRWLGRRPQTRGMAMNPCDHPHGGGEGRSKGGNHPVSPWGQPTKGFKTRRRKKYSNRWIQRRRK